MLVQFSVRNFKTFKDEVKLTLFASNYDKNTREEENVIEVPKFGLRLLKSAVIYGANASGKTKLMDAAKFMKTFILKSSKESQEGEPIDTDPFKLSTTTDNQPSMFEIVFIHKEDMYRYGFEVNKEEIIGEWLYHRSNKKEVEIFYRDGQNFELHSSFKIGSLFVKENMIRSNALMLSVAAQFNDGLAKNILEWFRKFRHLSGLREEEYMGYSLHKANDKAGKQEILEWLKNADTGIDDIRVDPMSPDNLPNSMPEELKAILVERMKEKDSAFYNDLTTIHAKYDENNMRVGSEHFSLSDEESSGTQKYFALSGPVIHALNEGGTLFVDEMDSKLHPNLIQKIVDLFNSQKTNQKNAQLIFNTHNTNLLSADLFRRDQIWFVEKNRYGAASLYPLSSFKTNEKARKDDNFEENYLLGRYGGIPVLSDFSALFNDAKNWDKDEK